MEQLRRLCVIAGSLFMLLAGIVAGGYYLYFRPMWMTPEVLVRIPRFLRDPATPLERLRDTALAGHELVLSGFVALDSAALLLIVVALTAAIALLYVGLKLRSAAKAQ
jgi:hypothetical protein